MASAVLAPYYMGKNPFNPSSQASNPKFHKKASQLNGNYNNLTSAGDNHNNYYDPQQLNRRDKRDDSDFVSYNVSSYTLNELKELKSRLVSELDQVRVLKSRIESGELQSHPSTSSNRKTGPPNNKRHLPPASSSDQRDPKRPSSVVSSSSATSLLKSCGQVLTKIMKHKQIFWFDKPVDVKGLGLLDYFSIVKNPMDLGTVKANLSRGLYHSPLEFASDVRLTFNNAMLYNPKGHAVYSVAEHLLGRFEDLFRPISEKIRFEEELSKGVDGDDFAQETSWNYNNNSHNGHHSRANNVGNVKAIHEIIGVSRTGENAVKRSSDLPLKKERQQVVPQQPLLPSNVQQNVVTNVNPPLVQSPVRTPSPKRASPLKPMPRTKLPKPKAKDLNKREMSMEEKQKLGLGLQSLPEEKMAQVVQIIKKRNGHLTEDGDEIELDIEAVDTETLWELDRFVTNWKKLVSKIKRQALMGNANGVAGNEGGLAGTEGDVAGNEGDVAANEGYTVSASGEPNVVASAKKAKRVEGGGGGEEDVDIGDEIPVSSFPPVEIEKDDAHGQAESSSSSSSSSSSDSSSSDSDSGSSSGSDSDADNAQSRDLSKT